MSAERPSQPPADLQSALALSACLGAWSYAPRTDRFRPSAGLAHLLGAPAKGAAAKDPADGVPLARFLGRVHPHDRPRIENMFFAAEENDEPFEMEFRTVSGPAGVLWLRLMGRPDGDPRGGACIRGLAFDLTEGRCARGTSAAQAHRCVNRLADYVIAAQGLAADLCNPPLARLLEQAAVEVGFELTRRLRSMGGARRH